MSLYMLRAHYTTDAFRAMLANPGDREAAARELFDAAGMKLQQMWYGAKGEVVCIVEGDVVNGATVAMVVAASGALNNATLEELLTPKQQVEAMRAAGEVSTKYRAPGK